MFASWLMCACVYILLLYVIDNNSKLYNESKMIWYEITRHPAVKWIVLKADILGSVPGYVLAVQTRRDRYRGIIMAWLSYFL